MNFLCPIGILNISYSTQTSIIPINYTISFLKSTQSCLKLSIRVLKSTIGYAVLWMKSLHVWLKYLNDSFLTSKTLSVFITAITWNYHSSFKLEQVDYSMVLVGGLTVQSQDYINTKRTNVSNNHHYCILWTSQKVDNLDFGVAGSVRLLEH